MWVEKSSPKFGKNMSRIGKLPINIPNTVTVNITGHKVSVNGPKGQLEWTFPGEVELETKDNQILVKSKASNLHGLSRSLVANMVQGVTEGWSKTLELSGTGYRASTNGNELNLSLGFSHPVVVKAPNNVTFTVSESKIIVSGIDKALVGQIAAQIRRLKPADPYKAKGFKYEGEVIKRKAGKAAKAGAGAAK